jgi:citrate lyase subunit beta/citryl-CoA lyase
MLAATPGVMRLVLGHLDFLADTGMRCEDEQSELAPLRFDIAIATRLNGLAPAVDGVTEHIGDQRRLRNDVRRAMRFGLRGKLCIHPAQVSIVHDAMAPTEEELVWARKVVAAADAANGDAVQVDGRMVDPPVILLARRLLGH